MVYNTGMLKRKERIRKEDFLTGFLQAMQFLMKILFFYGTGTLLYGFWQGITGGYLTLFAVMVISGAMIFRLLLMIMAGERKTTDSSLWCGDILEAVVLSTLAFRMNWKAGAVVLTGCVISLVMRRFLHGKPQKVVMNLVRYGFYIAGTFVSLQFFGKNAITFSDASALIAGVIFFGMDLSPDFAEKKESSVSEEKWKPGKEDLLPVVIGISRDAFGMASLACLTPLSVQIFNAEKEIHQMSGYRNLILCAVLAFIFQIISSLMEEKNTERKRGQECLSLAVTAACASVFLMHISVQIGVVYLLAFLALAAGVFLLKSTGHDRYRNVRMIAFVLSCLGVILVMAASFQTYDGIFVDYSVVLMAYFISMAATVMSEEICAYLPEDETE